MLKKVNRLRKRYQFNYTYKAGSHYSCPPMVLYVTPSKNKHLKVGFAVTRKIGHAYKRNLIRRRLREIVQAELPNLKTNFNIVLVARDCIENYSFAKLKEEFHKLVLKADILNEKVI